MYSEARWTRSTRMESPAWALRYTPRLGEPLGLKHLQRRGEVRHDRALAGAGLLHHDGVDVRRLLPLRLHDDLDLAGAGRRADGEADHCRQVWGRLRGLRLGGDVLAEPGG